MQTITGQVGKRETARVDSTCQVGVVAGRIEITQSGYTTESEIYKSVKAVEAETGIHKMSRQLRNLVKHQEARISLGRPVVSPDWGTR